MKKPRAVLATSAVFLSAALVASYFQFQQPTVKATEVLTWDCESAVHKPESITLTCADGGWMVHSISWSKWGIDGAEGTGIFREKLCEPNCADGEVAEEKVKVQLSDLTEREGDFYLRTLDISTASGKDFSSGRANGLEWDVMEFIEVMNWD